MPTKKLWDSSRARVTVIHRARMLDAKSHISTLPVAESRECTSSLTQTFGKMYLIWVVILVPIVALVAIACSIISRAETDRTEWTEFQIRYQYATSEEKKRMEDSLEKRPVCAKLLSRAPR